MTPPRFRIRTLMIVVALAAVIMALIAVVLRRYHFHDFYFRIG